MTLHVSGNWQLNTSLSTFESVQSENGPEHKFQSPKTRLPLGNSSSSSRPSIGRARFPSPPRGKLQGHPHAALFTGLIEEENRDTLSLPDKCGHRKKTGIGHSTLTNSTQRDGPFAYQTVENTLKYPSFLLRNIPWLLWLACDFLYEHVYSKVWSCNFPLLNVFFSSDIEGLTLS